MRFLTNNKFITFVFRYRGKASPDSVMADICWRVRNLDLAFNTHTAQATVYVEEEEEEFVECGECASYFNNESDDE